MGKKTFPSAGQADIKKDDQPSPTGLILRSYFSTLRMSRELRKREAKILPWSDDSVFNYYESDRQKAVSKQSPKNE